jgi:3-oxoacyl-(acyl-carrier-protein) synthase
LANASVKRPIGLAACGCVTALGDAAATYQALIAGTRALKPEAVLGSAGGDRVPMALCAGRSLDESAPPNWLAHVRQLATQIPATAERWGSPRFPVYVTSSNFGVGSLYAYRQTKSDAHLPYGTPSACVEWLRGELGWGENVTTFSHACVSAHLGLLQATRALHAGLAERALIFSFDFLSPFVAGGFHALKILNAEFPAPYENRATGSIGLGDGAAFAVLTREPAEFSIEAQSVHNEMYHFTANQADGAGFAACVQPLIELANGRRVWLKGHGTGTLEAGRLEATALGKAFPHAPLVSWKGSLGHTLGSCGAVELAIACEAARGGRTPGTLGSHAPGFTSEVAFDAFDNTTFDSVVCTSNAFGGAHAALLLSRA